jgi:hypothetical protein
MFAAMRRASSRVSSHPTRGKMEHFCHGELGTKAHITWMTIEPRCVTEYARAC